MDIGLVLIPTVKQRREKYPVNFLSQVSLYILATL